MGLGLGGGIAVNFGLCLLENCTITGNLASSPGQAFGSGVYGDQGTVGIVNSIVAGNLGTNDVSGNFSSLGHNIFGITNGLFFFLFDPTDLLGVDPRLGPLQDNGGPTLTHALLTGSPAIDAGASRFLLFDQRGERRPVDNPAIPNASGGDGNDIGALEVDPIVRCTAIQRRGNDILIKLTSLSDGAYTLEYRSNVDGREWTPLPGTFAGSGGVITITDSGAGTLPRRIYRARKL
jgi:hypothetical protein